MTENTAPRSLTDIPDTDDPIVLRELLRQAREQLDMHGSIEQMMAKNVARTEALLSEARAAQQHAPAGIDPTDLRSMLVEARTSMHEAISALERLEARLAHEAEAKPTSEQPSATPDTSPAEPPDGTSAIEVLIHDVTSPALARSLQQYLAGLDSVARAEVRELAEGLLRITVESSESLTGDSLAGWEPERDRTIRTERADVLEITLTT